MKVRLINGSPKPEELVCTAARNDYREDGVIGYSFRELMAGIEEDEAHLDALEAEGWNWQDNGHPRELEAKKRTLMDHLIRSGHWGPFEHPSATVAIEGVTRVVTHQLVRHRHFTYDQQSLRYVAFDNLGDTDDADELAEHFQFPPFIDEGEVVDREGVHEFDSEYVRRYYKQGYGWAAESYLNLLERGIPKEQARKVLPMGTLTNIVMSGNARAWMHILLVRQKADVQGETRRCADAIFEELSEWMPYAFEAYDDKRPMELTP